MFRELVKHFKNHQAKQVKIKSEYEQVYGCSKMFISQLTMQIFISILPSTTHHRTSSSYPNERNNHTHTCTCKLRP